jgi:hypothetical protein
MMPTLLSFDSEFTSLFPPVEICDLLAQFITGQGLTDFAITALTKRADGILERHDTAFLDAKAYGFFLESLGHRSKTFAGVPRRRCSLSARSAEGREITSLWKISCHN